MVVAGRHTTSAEVPVNLLRARGRCLSKEKRQIIPRPTIKPLKNVVN
jgi:hypothetical protein